MSLVYEVHSVAEDRLSCARCGAFFPPEALQLHADQGETIGLSIKQTRAGTHVAYLIDEPVTLEPDEALCRAK